MRSSAFAGADKFDGKWAMTDVSVVIPTYNRLALLKESIASVRIQSHPASEIIVVDDGSTDGTLNWCTTQNDIRLLHCNRGGPSAARNIGVSSSVSDWIAFLDSDDVWLPDHLETLIHVLQKSSNIRWLIANSIVTDAQLVPYQGIQGFAFAFPIFKKSVLRFNKIFPKVMGGLVWQGNAKKQALLGNWLQPSGLFLRRDFFMQVGGFNQRLFRCEDMDLLLRMSLFSHATLSLRQTYLWRQGQSDSLAADKNALLLKKGALNVLLNPGFKLVKNTPGLFPVWLWSVFQHGFDFVFSVVLRKLKSFENLAFLQAGIQTGVSLLNIITPVVLSRYMSQVDFSEYRTFGLYLSASTSLSLTSGFWSLLPFWNSQGESGKKDSAIAFKMTIVFSIASAILLLFMKPLSGHESSPMNSLFLSLSIIALLPSFFLEQRLCFDGKGLLTTIVSSLFEILKIIAIFVCIFSLKSIAAVFQVIFVFLVLKLAVLFWGSLRLNLIKRESLHVLSAWPVLKQAFPVCVASALLTLASTFDRFYLSRKLSAEEFAVIAAGFISLPFIGFFEQSVFQRAIPKIALALTENRFQEVEERLSNAVRQISDVVVPLTLTLVVFSNQIVRIIFDERYFGAGIILMLFSALNICACFPGDIVSRARGKSREIFIFSFINVFSVIGSVLIGYFYFGSLGVVAGCILTTLLCRILFFVYQLKVQDISVFRFIKRSFSFLKFVTFAFALVSVGWVLRKIAAGPLISLALAFVILVLYFVFFQLRWWQRKTLS